VQKLNTKIFNQKLSIL